MTQSKKLLNRLNLQKKVPKMSRQVDVQKIRENYKKLRSHNKVVLDGVYGVGKTSLFKRVFNLGFSEEKTAYVPHWSISTHQEILDEEETIIPVRLKNTILYFESNLKYRGFLRKRALLFILNTDNKM